MVLLIISVFFLLAAIYVGLNCMGIGLVPVLDGLLSRINSSSLLIILSLMSIVFLVFFATRRIINNRNGSDTLPRIKEIEDILVMMQTSIENQKQSINVGNESIKLIKQSLVRIAKTCQGAEESTKQLLEEAKEAMGKN